MRRRTSGPVRINEVALVESRTRMIEAERSYRELVLRDQCMEQALKLIADTNGDPLTVARLAREIEMYRREGTA